MLQFYIVASYYFVKKEELNKLYWCMKILVIPEFAKRDIFFFCLDIVIHSNNFLLKFCVTNGPQAETEQLHFLASRGQHNSKEGQEQQRKARTHRV